MGGLLLVLVGEVLFGDLAVEAGPAQRIGVGLKIALAEVNCLPPEDYYAVQATRAHLLRQLGRSQESRAAYDEAIGLAGNTPETAYLIRRRDQLAGP